jgi:two-component system sensor histidine kinase BaeS
MGLAIGYTMKSTKLRQMGGSRRSKYWTHKDPPHWWPEGEPWPPSSHDWRRARKRLFPRAILGAFFALLLSTLICSGAIYLIQVLSTGLDLPPRPVVFGIGLAIVTFLIAASILGRNLRRFFSPLDALLEASERLSVGETNVHVKERGVPEVRALIRSFNSMATQLRRQSEDRQNLLADVTHELRTPLTVIQGNIEGMLDGVYARDEEQLSELLRETQRMSTLIEDLRILALAERGGLPIRKEPVDLPQVCGEIISSFRSQAESKGVALTLETSEDLPLIEADPLRIGQMLANLLSNALHYTSEKDVITVHVAPTNEEKVQIQVRDNGEGIDREELPHIFDRFTKSSESQGTGLGLAIVKSLVEAHEGEIHAESDPGIGTTITIILPTNKRDNLGRRG